MRIATTLTQYPRCNLTSVSWASPVGDDELHTRENKTKWNGGGRWADIVTQSNTRNQTVPRPRCLESNTHVTLPCYMHSATMFRTCSYRNCFETKSTPQVNYSYDYFSVWLLFFDWWSIIAPWIQRYNYFHFLPSISGNGSSSPVSNGGEKKSSEWERFHRFVS